MAGDDWIGGIRLKLKSLFSIDFRKRPSDVCVLIGKTVALFSLELMLMLINTFTCCFVFTCRLSEIYIYIFFFFFFFGLFGEACFDLQVDTP